MSYRSRLARRDHALVSLVSSGAPRAVLALASLGVGLGVGLAPARAHAEPAPEVKIPEIHVERLEQAVTFQEAVRLAIAGHPNVVVAEQEIERARGLLRAARAFAFPTLYGNGTYTRLDDDRTLAASTAANGTVTPGRVISARDQINVNALLTVPLIAANPWVQWGQANEAIEVARLSTGDVKRAIAIQVGRAYLAVLASRRSVEVFERSLVTARAHADFSTERYKGGVGTRLDEVRAKQETAISQAQVENARTGLARAREALGVLAALGGPVDARDEVDLGDVRAGQGGREGAAVAAALSDAERRRQDVISARARVHLAERVAKEDWVEYVPTVNGTFQPFYQNPPTLTLPTWGWQAQVVLSIPFYDGGAREGRMRQRDALAAQAKATLEGLTRQTRADVRAANEAMDRADKALTATRDSADLAREALELATIAYRAGASTNIEIVDAERRLRDAESQVASAEDAVRQARLDFLAACGRFP